VPSEWPKPWDEITGISEQTTEPDAKYFASGFGPSWMDMGPLRIYDETVYINADGGHETDENRDRWMPFGVYIEQHCSD